MKRPFVFLLLLLCFAGNLHAANKRILLIAGKPSHGPGDHEFRAGCLLLQKCLAGVKGITTEVYTNGWPTDDKVFAGASAVLIYADGGTGNPAIQANHTQILDDLAKKGAGIGFAHFGVEVPKGAAGDSMWWWIGGYYEDHYSVNPMWTPEFNTFPNHPITRGVKPFTVLDEWYFNMRWRPDTDNITPILVATPPDKVRNGPYVYPKGPYPHIQEAKGRAETMMWAFTRAGGGRGLGFTGGHRFVNWENENFRKVVLNGLLWLAKVEVPKEGVNSSLDGYDLKANLDPKK
ncbi:MAG TPA: ThuA domain-containing protein [Verrucomicrobiae bacterium]|nr:ThuA domain-containing protein [Verrucomicrobiae bacterium]